MSNTVSSNNAWKQTLRSRISPTKAKRAWMVWAIWGMLGTSLTLEGTKGMAGLGGLSVALLLTAPFWAAFAAWPVIYVWRCIRDKDLWTEKVELLVHDPESETPFGLEILVGRDGVRVAVPELLSVSGAAEALAGMARLAPDAKAGLPFETMTAETLAAWGDAWLAAHTDDASATSDVATLARWSNTLRFAAAR